MKNSPFISFILIFLSSAIILGAGKYKPVTINLKNPVQLSRQDEVITIPVSKVKAVSTDFDVNFLAIKDGRKIIPYVVIKNAKDNEIIFQVSFNPGEQKQIIFSWSKNKPDGKAVRTRAYLAIKKDYVLKDGVYTGGNFESVNSVVVPKSHFQHDALYQMEGPSWESDKVAYRFYLDDRNRTDIFGKSTPKMILNIVGKNDLLSGDESYERPLWWGQDIFKVGNSLGIGSVAAFINNKVETVSETDSIKCHVVNNSVFSSVVTEHFGWKVGNEKVNIKTDYTIYPGTRLTEVNVNTDKPVESFCTGLAKHENTEFLSSDNTGNWGYIGLWGKQTIINDDLGIALFYNTGERIKLAEDNLSHIVVLKSENNNANYYFAACWDKEKNGVKTLKDFQKFLNQTKERLDNPVILEIR